MNLFMIFFLLISEFYTSQLYVNVFYLILSEIIKKIYKQLIKIHAQTLFKSTFSLIRVKMSPTIPFYSPPTLTSLFFCLQILFLVVRHFVVLNTGHNEVEVFLKLHSFFKFIHNFTNSWGVQKLIGQSLDYKFNLILFC